MTMRSMPPQVAAKALRVTPACVRGWCRKHRIGVRVGGRWWVSAQAVELIGHGTPLDQVASHVSNT